MKSKPNRYKDPVIRNKLDNIARLRGSRQKVNHGKIKKAKGF